MTRRLAAVAVLALLASGCGTKNATDAAQLVPADALYLVHLHGARPPAPAAFPHAPTAYALLDAALPRSFMRIARAEDIALLPEGPVAFVRAKKLAPPGFLRRRIRGFTVLARTKAAIDAVRHAKRRLADDARYVAATKSLGDAPLTAYLSKPYRGDAPDAARWAALEVTRTTVALRYRTAPTHPAHLTSVAVPKDTLAAVGLGGPNPPASSTATLETISHALGVDVATLLRALDGPAFAYLEPGAPVPRITIVASPAHPARARRAVGELFAPLGRPAISPSPKLTTVDLGPVAIFYGLVDGRLVLSDDEGSAEETTSTTSVHGLPDSVTRFALWRRVAGPAIAAVAPGLGIASPSGKTSFLLYETEDEGSWSRVLTLD